jgi:hypothetical protein
MVIIREHAILMSKRTVCSSVSVFPVRWVPIAPTDHSARAVYVTILFAHSEHRDHGFESHSTHKYLRLCCICVCYPVYVAALRRADLLSKESYRLSITKKLKKKN